MLAIILAGGFGTRLRPAVADVPKPLAPVGERPFLYHLIEYLASCGIREAVLCAHYQHEKISAHFREEGLTIPVRMLSESTPRGTGGAIARALKLLRPSAPVLALNGDCFLQGDYRAMLARHHALGVKLTLALRRVENCSRYGQVEVSGGKIACFRTQGEATPGLISAGAYILNPDIFEGFDFPAAFSIEHDFFAPYAASLGAGAFLTDGYFIDIGVPEDYARACTEIPALCNAAAA